VLAGAAPVNLEPDGHGRGCVEVEGHGVAAVAGNAKDGVLFLMLGHVCLTFAGAMKKICPRRQGLPPGTEMGDQLVEIGLWLGIAAAGVSDSWDTAR